MKNGRSTAVIAVTLLLLCAASTLHAQMLMGLTLEKLGILTTPGTGARPFGMGTAYTAVSDDAFALLYNPAGLAQIRRKEASFGLHHARHDVTNRYIARQGEQNSSFTSLGHLAAVYPYPTYRGGLVFGFGVFKAGSSDMETFRRGYVSEKLAQVTNLYLQSGNLYQYHIGAGVDISPRISIGASLVIWDESINFTEEISYADPGSTAVQLDDVSMDLDGFNFNIGLLVRLHENVRAGFMFSSPAWINIDGEGITRYYGEYNTIPAEGWDIDEFGTIEEKFTLPMQFRGGLAVNISHLLLSADLAYIEYSQTKWEGVTIVDEFDESAGKVLDDVLNVHIGAEISLPWYPVRIRGGYSYSPLFMSTMEEITFFEDDYPKSYIGDFDVLTERQFFTFGLGTLVDRVLSLDVAAAIGGFKRETEDAREDRNITEVFLSGAYRF